MWRQCSGLAVASWVWVPRRRGLSVFIARLRKSYGSYRGGQGRALALEGALRMLTVLASNEGVAQDILEALSGLVACLRGSSEDCYLEFVPLLDRLMCSPRSVLRRQVLRWATIFFSASASECRYYALRLCGDQDRDVVKFAEIALLAGRHEASWLALLTSHSTDKMASQPSFSSLAFNLSQSDICRALAFLHELLEAEGMHLTAEGLDAGGPPMPKRPRLQGPYDDAVTTKGRKIGAPVSPPR